MLSLTLTIGRNRSSGSRPRARSLARSGDWIRCTRGTRLSCATKRREKFFVTDLGNLPETYITWDNLSLQKCSFIYVAARGPLTMTACTKNEHMLVIRDDRSFDFPNEKFPCGNTSRSTGEASSRGRPSAVPGRSASKRARPAHGFRFCVWN